MALLDIIILCALVRLNLEMKSPVPCTVIYVVVALFFMLISGLPIFAMLVSAVTYAAMALLFFWALIKTKNSAAWWVIAVVGVLVLGIF
ncbi:hypothetical protein [Cerasicoccus fimbriatus]|uniref:hypothetical protein n=1 Tax=Cerasicoccus fimbriatus TaxID=3014554 RepID=UPI0022B42449|nr:hypothetical protein [Cerasicoccus sp. TK19100]